MTNIELLHQKAKGLCVCYIFDQNDSVYVKLLPFFKKIFNKLLTVESIDELEHFEDDKLIDMFILDVASENLLNSVQMLQDLTEGRFELLIVTSGLELEIAQKVASLSRYNLIHKPFNANELVKQMQLAIKNAKIEHQQNLSDEFIYNSFHYESVMVLLLKNKNAIYANQRFLDYCSFTSIKELRENSAYIESSIVDVLQESSKECKEYIIELKNKKNEIHKFLTKYTTVMDEPSYGVVTFDDITQLELLVLPQSEPKEITNKEKDEMMHLLDTIKQKGELVSLHNYYKGLHVSNKGVITQIEGNEVCIKTDFKQLKALQYDTEVLIESDLFPYVVSAKKIIKIDLVAHTVWLGKLEYEKHTQIERELAKLVPEENHQVSLYIDGQKYCGKISIKDISLNAVKIALDALPVSLKISKEVVLDLVLQINNKMQMLHTEAVVFKIEETESAYMLIAKFILESDKRKMLVKYISSRQMMLIREFKGVVDGK